MFRVFDAFCLVVSLVCISFRVVRFCVTKHTPHHHYFFFASFGARVQYSFWTTT